MLSDRSGLACQLKDAGFAAAELGKVLETIGQKAESFGESGSKDEWNIVERADLKPNGVHVTLKLRGLLPSEAKTNAVIGPRISRQVPVLLKRRGVETRLVIPGEAIAPSRPDPALLRALARGYQWFAELASGRSISTRQIAMREGLSESYVRHVVPLGLLAPSLVESICDGKQASTLTAERLKAQAVIPIDWTAQEHLLSN